MEFPQFKFFNEMLKDSFHQMNPSENIPDYYQDNRFDPLRKEARSEIMAMKVRNYLLIRQIHDMNALWEVMVNSQNKNSFEKFDNIIDQLEYSTRRTISDTRLIKKLLNDSSWQDVPETMKKNLMSEHFYPKNWIHAFNITTKQKRISDPVTQMNPSIARKDAETQTIFQLASFHLPIKDDGKQTVSKEVELLKTQQSIKTLPTVKNNQCKRDGIKEKYNIKVDNYYDSNHKATKFQNMSYQPKEVIYTPSMQNRNWQQEQQQQRTNTPNKRIHETHNRNGSVLKHRTHNNKTFNYNQNKNESNLKNNRHLNNDLLIILSSVIINWLESHAARNRPIRPEANIHFNHNFKYNERSRMKKFMI